MARDAIGCCVFGGKRLRYWAGIIGTKPAGSEDWLLRGGMRNEAENAEVLGLFTREALGCDDFQAAPRLVLGALAAGWRGPPCRAGEYVRGSAGRDGGLCEPKLKLRKWLRFMALAEFAQIDQSIERLAA